MNIKVIIFMLYFFFSAIIGYRFLSGRNEWLDRDAILNRMIKLFFGIFIGQFLSVFLFILWLIFKIVHCHNRPWRRPF